MATFLKVLGTELAHCVWLRTVPQCFRNKKGVLTVLTTQKCGVSQWGRLCPVAKFRARRWT